MLIIYKHKWSLDAVVVNNNNNNNNNNNIIINEYKLGNCLVY